MRVFISLCGEGLGHTSRMLALSHALKEKGHRAVFAGYGTSLKVMKEKKLEAVETFPEVKMTGSGGTFDLVSSIVKSYDTPFDLMKAYVLERKKIREIKADAVISDSRLATVIAGTMEGVPTFYVTNQSEFKLPSISVIKSKRLQALRIMARARLPAESIRKIIDAPLSVPYGFSDQVLVPDFKPPYTVCLPLLSRELEMKKKTFFAGPMNELCFGKVKPAKWESRKPKILVTLGGQKFRAGLMEKLLREARRHAEFEFMVSSLFIEQDSEHGNVKLRRFLPDVLPFAAAADFLVIPAGHSSIMESILLEKPALVIPDKGQPEQESNAKMYEKLGLGKALSVDQVWEMGGAIKALKEKEKSHQERLALLSHAASNSQNGARSAVRMVSEFVERIKY